jgi:hypothetical protein
MLKLDLLTPYFELMTFILAIVLAVVLAMITLGIAWNPA